MVFENTMTFLDLEKTPQITKIFKSSTLTPKLLSSSAQMLHENLFNLLVFDIANSYENFDFTSVFGLGKNSKNLSVHNKMVISTKVVA